MRQDRSNRLATSSLGVAGLMLGLALTCLSAAPAAAQAAINPEQACKDDAFKFCNDFIPDRDKVGACLRRNARSLSRDCRTVVSGGGGGRHVAAHRTYKHYRHR
jgi:hypothetical protein